MTLSSHIRFFNFFRSFFKSEPFGILFSALTKGKGYDNFFVKCLPQNYQYQKGSLRIVKRYGINYELDLSEYMEWVIYFGLNVEEREGLYPLVKEGMTVLDIGTNIGETLLNFASITGMSGKVYGFEPVDENYRKCMRNVSLNSFLNITVSKLALSDKKEMLYFGLPENKNSGGIFMSRKKSETGFSAEAMKLDDFVENNNISQMDLVKIDVEGFEYNVLKGGEKVLKLFRPILFVEVDELNLQRQGASSVSLINLIRSYGYEVRKADGSVFRKTGDVHYDIICEPVKN